MGERDREFLQKELQIQGAGASQVGHLLGEVEGHQEDQNQVEEELQEGQSQEVGECQVG